LEFYQKILIGLKSTVKNSGFSMLYLIKAREYVVPTTEDVTLSPAVTLYDIFIKIRLVQYRCLVKIYF